MHLELLSTGPVFLRHELLEASGTTKLASNLTGLRRQLGETLWNYLLDWGVLAKIAAGEWTRENGLDLLRQLLDTGVKVPLTLFWFGIIPPIPGKIWTYAFTALSLYGFIYPNSAVHRMLKRFVYPSAWDRVEKARANRRPPAPPGRPNWRYRPDLEQLSEAKHRYALVKFDLPKDVASKIVGWGKSHVAEDDIDPEDGWEYRPHVTVLFGLHTDNPAEVREVLRWQEPFTVRLGKTSAFHNEHQDVLKLSVSGRELHALHDRLAAQLEHTQTHPRYQPHVTIAYLRPGRARKYVGDDHFEGVEITVDEVVYSSPERETTKIKLGRV